MKFEDMTIRQLISECEKMQKYLKNWESKMSAIINDMSENIKILGRQNKKLKRDNERYRRLLDRNPNKNVDNNKKITNDNILFELIVPDNTPLMLGDKVIGMVADSDDYYTCKIFKECISANFTSEEDNSYVITSFMIKERDEEF